MSQQEEREDTTVEPENGQLPEEAVLEAEEPDARDDSEVEEAEEKDETPEEAITRLQAELAEAQDQAASHLDKMQRTVAEYENAGKRRERQNEERIKRATGKYDASAAGLFSMTSIWPFRMCPKQCRVRIRPGCRDSSRSSRRLLDILANSEVEPLDKSGGIRPQSA